MNRNITIALVLTFLMCTAGCQFFPFDPEGKTIPAEPPVFDPPAGTYAGPIDVTISSASENATVFYALDSEDPSGATGSVYTDPIHLTHSATIHAIAYRDDLLPSEITSATYTIPEPPPENEPPMFEDVDPTGTLIEGLSCTLTLTCVVTDTDGTVEAVEASLLDVNGPSVQPLAQEGDTWSWTGSVTPDEIGEKTIVLWATDDDGDTNAFWVEIQVEPTPSPTEKWRFSTGDWIWSSPAADDDGTIFVGSLDGKVYAVNPDGSKKWEYQTGSYVYATPTVADDLTVLVASRDFYLYALNPDGSKKWASAYSADSSAAVVRDGTGTIYVGSIPKPGTGTTATAGPGKLYALNPDGSIKWEFDTGGSIWSSPAVGRNGTIYVGSRDYHIYAIDPGTGEEDWRFPTGGQVNSSPAVAEDGTICVGSMDGNVYAIKPDGSEKWRFTADGGVDSSPAVDPQGTTYVGSTAGTLYAIHPDGTLKWRYATDGAIISSPAVDTDGVVYVGSRDKAVYAVKPDGTLKWLFRTRGDVVSSPLLMNGTLYVGSYDGNLYALEAGDPPAAGWPMFRRNVHRNANGYQAGNVVPRVWDAVLDFSADRGNPNGAWSYGWMDAGFTSFYTYTNHGYGAANNSPVWWGTGTDMTPSAWRNTGPTAYGVAMGQLALHPSAAHEPSVLRWTAPSGVSGRVEVQTIFLPGDIGDMMVGVRDKGNLIYQSPDSGDLAFTTTVMPGDTIDFAVYGGYGYGNTPVAAQILWLGPTNTAPQISNVTVTGDIWQYSSNFIDISCTAIDPDGTVLSVTMDLSPLGGPAAATMTHDGGNLWVWSGEVQPPPGTADQVSIVLTARDDGGKTGTATILVNVMPS